jgi:hypothetical protein
VWLALQQLNEGFFLVDYFFVVAGVHYTVPLTRYEKVPFSDENRDFEVFLCLNEELDIGKVFKGQF